MKAWRENVIMKALAFIAAVAAFTATAILAWYQLANFDALWERDYTDTEGRGYTLSFLVQQDSYGVKHLISYYKQREAGSELSYSDKRAIEQYEAEYDAAATNLRWQLLDTDGNILYGNTREDNSKIDVDYWLDYRPRSAGAEESHPTIEARWDYWNPDVGAVNGADYTSLCHDDRWREGLSGLVEAFREDSGAPLLLSNGDGSDSPAPVEIWPDTLLADDNGDTNVLRVETPSGTYIYGPTVRSCLEPNLFGYIFDPNDLSWMQTPASLEETAQKTDETVSLVMWVDPALRVADRYQRAAYKLQEWQSARERNLATTIVCGVAGLLLMVYLCCAAGHKKGVDGVYLNWFHRAPGDVLLFLMFLGGVAAVGVGIELTMNAYMYWPMYMQLICIGTAVGVAAALGIGALMTVCARCKAHTLLRNTLTWRLCAWGWTLVVLCWAKLGELFRAMGRAVEAVPLIWKAVMGCMAYGLFTIVTVDNGNASGLWLLVSTFVALYLCGWAYQWKKIRRGTQEIIGGNPNYHIDTRHMYPDLRGHADELNNLGHSISAAVEDRMKSEHFKAELITNVSHDLKTPLTSIINYVDLLKKVDIADPKAQEYIEVLDRKSQRLKKLTEDLVEASKASTGNLTVNWERLDFKQLADQALAECGDRLEAQGLTVVRTLTEEPVWVDADGRHLWRILDNLLSNCAKYALPGTRVYVDLRESSGWAVLSVKNISRDALDIPADRLMERFVRGDESRNASGSGLGLSIAQSLTELQHGKFEISIDGDLFKAVVSLPLSGADPGGLPILRL